MKKTILTILLFTSYQAESYFDPISTFQKLCIHHTENAPSEIFAIIPGNQPNCPTYVNQHNGCTEFHKDNGEVIVQCPNTQSPSSQHCWVEKKELNDE